MCEIGWKIRRRRLAVARWSPQSAEESKLLGMVSCTSELAAHETGNLHDIILKSVHCPLSIPQIAQLISPDTRAGMPPDPACNFVCDSHDA